MAKHATFIHGPPAGGNGDSFPETQTTILAEAAAGKWDRFFDYYLRPSWNEVVHCCRQRGIPLTDADDLFQELTLRLVREGKSRTIRLADHQGEAAVELRGNLPERYLSYRRLYRRTVRFRTYLKSVVKNIVLERARELRRSPRLIPEIELQAVDSWIGDVVSLSVDRPWLQGCFAEAVWRLKHESETARTRGKRRLFSVLYGSLVERKSSAQLGAALGIDRTTVSQLLADGRARLIELLQESTGLKDVVELKQQVILAPDLLADALRSAGQS